MSARWPGFPVTKTKVKGRGRERPRHTFFTKLYDQAHNQFMSAHVLTSAE
jgi:hypothetical protein